MKVMRRLWLLVPLVLLGCAGEPEQPAEAVRPSTTLVLAGDGELWVVDVDSAHVERRQTEKLRPGDPPLRVVRRGDRFVFWGFATYSAADPLGQLDAIAHDSWFFIPSAHPDRIWLAVLDEDSPATQNALKAVREVTGDGRVTAPDVRPPGGRWPQGAVASGLIFDVDGAMRLWDPRTQRFVRDVDVGIPGPAQGDLIASCDNDCRELWLTDLSSNERRVARAPDGGSLEVFAASFSADGRTLAAPLGDFHEAPANLALIDLETLQTTVVPNSTVRKGYHFTAWSADGREVFLTGGDRFKTREIVAYRIGDAAARRLPVEVGDFYGIAAR